MSEHTIIRHPPRIPLEVAPAGAASAGAATSEGIALLSFESPTGQSPGMLLRLRFPVDPAFETAARVSWCRRHEDGFEIGVCLLSREDAYRARMVEQLCHIEAYRRQVAETEGRSLAPDAAALEWITRYAEDFPALALEA